MLRVIVFATFATALLAACASPQQQQRSRLASMAERALDRMEVEAPRADPGLVAATDIAFARSARDTDLLSAFREYAANGAIRHAGRGAIDLEVSLIGHPPVPEAERWAPNAVWSSCNGRYAVSFGKFVTPGGTVGTYATLWQRQRDRTIPYKWLYRLAAKDAAQPAPRPKLDELSGEDVIVVEELTAINARTADCARPSAADMPPPPSRDVAMSSAHHTGLSDDGTLYWEWEHREDGTRVFIADYLRDGVWEEVVNMTVGDAGVVGP